MFQLPSQTTGCCSPESETYHNTISCISREVALEVKLFPEEEEVKDEAARERSNSPNAHDTRSTRSQEQWVCMSQHTTEEWPEITCANVSASSQKFEWQLVNAHRIQTITSQMSIPYRTGTTPRCPRDMDLKQPLIASTWWNASCLRSTTVFK